MSTSHEQSQSQWSTRLRLGVEYVLGMPMAARAWRDHIGDREAASLIAALGGVPPLEDFHHPTPGRENGKSRQRFSAVDLLADGRARELIAALETSGGSSIGALGRLLTDRAKSTTEEEALCALGCLPAAWKLEICWPRQKLDQLLAARLAPNERFTGLSTRKHVTRGIRCRVVPSVGANHTHNTNLTTLSRAAVYVWQRIASKKGPQIEL